jgi:nucleoside-diphosphate kinase
MVILNSPHNTCIVLQKEVLRLSRDQAAEFYEEQALAPYFTKLVDHMSGAPIVVYVLSKRNCVEEWLRLIGPANVSRAKRLFPVSLRAIYGTEQGPDPVANAFHGSGSPAEAEREIKFFFPNSTRDITHRLPSRYHNHALQLIINIIIII